jgi:TetR/AcrR family transcriptional repressor of mexJK operon
VLAGARAVFMRDGFEGANVDVIARESAVSKATLYSYFSDKRLLFMEVAKAECLRQANEALELIDQTAAPADVLRAAAERIIAFMISDFGLRMFRICVAETDRFPTLGQDFYESGPLLVRERLMAYFEFAATRGDLAIADMELAADQFAELCSAGIHARLVFGVGGPCSEAEVARTVTGAVEMFLARYATTT